MTTYQAATERVARFRAKLAQAEAAGSASGVAFWTREIARSAAAVEHANQERPAMPVATAALDSYLTLCSTATHAKARVPLLTVHSFLERLGDPNQLLADAVLEEVVTVTLDAKGDAWVVKA